MSDKARERHSPGASDGPEQGQVPHPAVGVKGHLHSQAALQATRRKLLRHEGH